MSAGRLPWSPHPGQRAASRLGPAFFDSLRAGNSGPAATEGIAEPEREQGARSGSAWPIEPSRHSIDAARQAIADHFDRAASLPPPPHCASCLVGYDAAAVLDAYARQLELELAELGGME